MEFLAKAHEALAELGAVALLFFARPRGFSRDKAAALSCEALGPGSTSKASWAAAACLSNDAELLPEKLRIAANQQRISNRDAS